MRSPIGKGNLVNLRNKLARVGLCLSLLLTLGAYVAASAAPVSADTTWCGSTIVPSNRWVGNKLTHGSENFDHIEAKIDVDSYTGAFAICGFTPVDWDNNGASAWVAVVPGNTNPYDGSSSAILQIGLIRCADVGVAACDGNDSPPRVFWAYGGCNGAVPVARFIDGGDTYSEYKYTIRYEAGYWKLYRGVTLEAQISTSHSAISCWITGDRELQVMGEKLDIGDSVGSNNNHHTEFRGVKYSLSGDPTLYTPSSWTVGSACSLVSSNREHCSRLVVNGFDIWTDQTP